ncbi:MAG: KipI antagonist [Smithella sp. PtaU1.Bin162]|nr:MAG: KipI antagonist [Smithella sp. PtaU1.Bin162]
MIEILNKGMMTCVVDSGRYGYAAIGVPPSAALDKFAYNVLNCLLNQDENAPALEIIGAGFSIKFHQDMICAITGARVRASLDERSLSPWASFAAEAGSILTVHEVTEGFRYYLGFTGKLSLPRVIGCYATNLECSFGGYQGRSLKGGDQIEINDIYSVPLGIVPDKEIPEMKSPHFLRITDGPEHSFFTEKSQKTFADRESRTEYTVSVNSNRTGIRLTGDQLSFCDGVKESIISEGILPGTIQIPGDGLPIIMLYERTIGGYARIARVVRADLDRLAHLIPEDQVIFGRIEMDEAERLWEERRARLKSFL